MSRAATLLSTLGHLQSLMRVAQTAKVQQRYIRAHLSDRLQWQCASNSSQKLIGIMVSGKFLMIVTASELDSYIYKSPTGSRVLQI